MASSKKGCGIGCFAIVIIFIILSIIGSFFGSDDNSNSGQKEEKIEYSIGQTVKTEKIEFTVLSTDKQKSVSIDDSGYFQYTAEGNNIYYIIKVKIKNISKESIDLDTSGFKLLNNDISYTPSMLFTDSAMNFDGINPGTEIERNLYFDIPEDADLSNATLEAGDNIFSDTGEIKIKLN